MTFNELMERKLFYIGDTTSRYPYQVYDLYFSVYTSRELAEEELKASPGDYEVFEIKNNKNFFEFVAQKQFLHYVVDGEGDVFKVTPPKISNTNMSFENTSSPVKAPEPTQNPRSYVAEKTVVEEEKKVSQVQNTPKITSRPIVAVLHFIVAGAALLLALCGLLVQDIAFVSFLAMFILHLAFGIFALKKYMRASIASFISPFFLTIFIFGEIEQFGSGGSSVLFVFLILITYFLFRNRPSKHRNNQ
ncbi:MAG: hypothetical protein IJO09_09190 [Oscillospiraceae bacterium]|nr:hypothetical protein [Oscillospiraceae bacterium]